MTARELVSTFRPLSFPATEDFFLYLAAHIPEMRLSDGQRLNDATDFAAFLRELADVLESQRTCRAPAAEAREKLDHTCPRCGHIHEGILECGMEIGSGRICRCEMSVPV